MIPVFRGREVWFVRLDGRKRPIALDGTYEVGRMVGALHHPGLPAIRLSIPPCQPYRSILLADVTNLILR